jgi:leucine-rich repeat-containing protein 49
MLGKNYIERIRNLQNLNKLDVLDLHSNKITKIENINHLSELRVLNLANNLITAVENLNGLISLTELNLRRNLIETVHGLQHCPRLQRIFLSNNRIEKFDHIGSLKDATQLQELALDGNPIYHLKGYFEFCLVTCPNLKHLDLRKITPEMRESGGGGGVKGEIKKIEDSNGKGSENGNMSTDISPDKQTANNML